MPLLLHKPSHEGYRNTIELPVGNNAVPLQSDTIWLVQNGCSFHGLRSEDPNQHLKDFLKLVDSLDLDGSITTWEDLTTRFLAQFFPSERTAKLHNDILMFQQHHDHVSFHLKYEIDSAAGCKLRNKNANESLEIIENLALYDHEGWTDMKEFVKPVKDISTPQGISKTPDRRLLELEDQINFLLKRSTHIPHVYADAVYSNPRPQSHNKPPKLNPFTFCEHTGPSPQPQALRTTFKARVRDYMVAHPEKIERFENIIFKQREKSNDKMTKIEEERSDKTDETLDNTVKSTITETEIPMKEAARNNETKNKSIKKSGKKEVEEVLSSWPVEYYLKHRINEKLIEGLVDNNRFNNSLSRARVGKVKENTYNVLPRGPVYDAILKKKITKKEDVRGNFKIPCSIGGLKHMNALVDQGSDVNVMPYFTYMKFTNEMRAKIDIRPH
nr:MAK10-like protein [Tanacetum cinerariifolium]